MKGLNYRYRGVDSPTDVLSFPQFEGRAASFHPSPLLGDIVINLHAAERQASRFGNTLYEEVRRLLVHGFLHLMGYDHEKNAYQDRKMRKKERDLQDALEAVD